MKKGENMEPQKREVIWREFCKMFWIFILGCFLGFVYETILVLFQKGHFELRQGLIYGPLIPVYGIGGVVYYIFFRAAKPKGKWEVFFFSMLLGGVTEYISSWVQEAAFGTISWDYSYLRLNFNGRTSVLHCIYWGIAGVLYITWIEPWIEKFGKIAAKKWVKIATCICTVLLIVDIVISCMAAARQNERVHQIPAEGVVDEFFDKYYPDEFMNSIYTNKKHK